MWIFGRKGPSGFSGRSTAEEVTHGIDGTDLTAIVTGATSGIGEETARVLALRGVHVTMAVRNTKAGTKVKEKILEKNPNAKINTMELDLSSLTSVRKFATEYKASGLPLNILINNAGIMGIPFSLSQDDIELQFATNHLGHFLLTNLLLETMKKTWRETGKEGRIVNVTSSAHAYTYKGGIRFNNLNDEKGYNAMTSYGQSKLANVLHANELARILKAEGVEITANSVHPGAVATNILRRSGFVFDVVRFLGHVIKYAVKNPQQGAATQCYVALNPQVKGVSGEYFVDSNKAETSSKAKDIDLAKKLWDFSLNLTKPK